MLSEAVKLKAQQLGFVVCGFSQATDTGEDAKFVEKWLAAGKHGNMSWMQRNKEKRYDPRQIVEDAKTLISVAYNYYTDEIPEKSSYYKLSKYACGKDYHYIIKQRLQQLLSFIEEKSGKRKARIFVDSAPLLERYHAKKSGLGFIGKNTCLINRTIGSFFFIGHIIIDIELKYNETVLANFCGSCTRCLDACPTAALKPFELDARKCISYITIEYHNSEISEYFKGKMQNYIFGCDICQDVCPWNRQIKKHNETLFSPSVQLQEMQKTDWEQLNRPFFKKLFKHTPIERAGFKQLQRNIRFCADNQ